MAETIPKKIALALPAAAFLAPFTRGFSTTFDRGADRDRKHIGCLLGGREEARKWLAPVWRAVSVNGALPTRDRAVFRRAEGRERPKPELQVEGPGCSCPPQSLYWAPAGRETITAEVVIAPARLLMLFQAGGDRRHPANFRFFSTPDTEARPMA